MKHLWMSALLGVCALGLSAQDPDRTLRPQQVTVPAVAREARVALVVGNSAYAEAFLKNPVNDAREMKAALESCKFEVTLLTNASKRQMEEAIAAFGNRIRGGAVGVFYFAGHGLQVRGANYLIPVGARLEKESDVTYEGVDVGKVLDEMDAAKNQLNILILDACRNNPFARSWRSADKGLAQVSAPTGSLIAYATAPGRTAADGTGEHGAYTEALLAELREPGLKAEDLFKRVRVRVTQVTGDQQVPWESSSLKGDFYFRPLATNLTGPTEAELEATYWEGIQNSREAKEFDAYLLRFPGGAHAELAKLKVKALRAAAPVVVSNLAEPWKALVKDEFETKDEFAARVRSLGPIVVGRVDVDRKNYSLDSGRLSLPVHAAEWAKPHVNVPTMVIPLERSQARSLVEVGSTAPLIARFDAPGGMVRATELLVSLGQLNPQFNGPSPSAATWTNSIGMKLARIPAGKFKMGSTNYHESPVHEVTISRAFWMGVFHVTQAQYEAVMGGNPSCFKNAGSYAPVECVTWNEARAFCQILTGMEGGGMEYRLPTEAEWEYACRAGTEGETYGPLDAIAWHLGNSGKTTHPVGQKRPNAFGLYDMLGNVWQWCQDWSAFYSAGPVTDPQGPSTGSGGGIRIMRGGSWARSVVFDDRNLCRSAERGGNSQGEGANNIGFRVVAVARTP